MSDEYLTTQLALRAMNWRLAPGRYLKPGGGWTSRSGFRPLVDVGDALKALESVTEDYALTARPGRDVTIEVRLPGRTGQAVGKSKARAICLSLAPRRPVRLRTLRHDQRVRHLDEPDIPAEYSEHRVDGESVAVRVLPETARAGGRGGSRTCSSDERARQRSPELSRMTAQNRRSERQVPVKPLKSPIVLIVPQGQAGVDPRRPRKTPKALNSPQCSAPLENFRAPKTPVSASIEAKAPGKEHKGLFYGGVVFHSQRVRGQWFAVLNKLPLVFNKCSTLEFGESGQPYREPQQKNVSKTVILGRYMWSFLMEQDAVIPRGGDMTARRPSASRAVIDAAASEASGKVKGSPEADATGADLSAGELR